MYKVELRHGRQYPGKKSWTKAYRRWLLNQTGFTGEVRVVHSAAMLAVSSVS
jgi:hypothetical protein